MLVLTRRINESIIIDDGIKVYLLDIKGRRARIGIDAPRDITVHREEIYERIQLQKEDEALID